MKVQRYINKWNSQFNSKWQTSNNDELIDVVIENSCSEFISG